MSNKETERFNETIEELKGDVMGATERPDDDFLDNLFFGVQEDKAKLKYVRRAVNAHEALIAENKALKAQLNTNADYEGLKMRTHDTLTKLLSEAEKVMTDSADRGELSDEDGSLLADIRSVLALAKGEE